MGWKKSLEYCMQRKRRAGVFRESRRVLSSVTMLLLPLLLLLVCVCVCVYVCVCVRERERERETGKRDFKEMCYRL